MPQTYLASKVDIIKVRRGDYFERVFLPNVDFSGRSGRFTVRAAASDSSALLTVTPSGVTVLAGSITVIAGATATAVLKAGVYYHKLEVYTTAEDNQTIMDGIFEVID